MNRFQKLQKRLGGVGGLQRVAPGHYRAGDMEVTDTYSPDGAPHTRSVTLRRDRWLLKVAGKAVRRFNRLRDAREYVEGRF